MNAFNLTDLKRSISDALDLLRGTAAINNPGDYVLPLIFIQCISALVDSSNNKSFRTHTPRMFFSHHKRQHISELATTLSKWSDTESYVTSSARVNRILNQISEAFPTQLVGISNSFLYLTQSLGPEVQSDRVISALAECFPSDVYISHDEMHRIEPSEYFDAAVSLLAVFGRKGEAHEYITPREVADLMSRLLPRSNVASVYDPTCGSGALLAAAVKYLWENGQSHIDIEGQEKNVSALSIAKMSLFLKGLDTSNLHPGDVISSPAILSPTNRKQFDVVISNPPWGLKDWGYEYAAVDPYLRFSWGLPPRGNGDYAFLQHMLASTNLKGVVLSIVPNGTLFRGGSEASIRRSLIEGKLISAVIALPSKLFFNKSIQANILILSPGNSESTILFIDGSREAVMEGRLNRLTPDGTQKIAETYHDRSSIDGFSRAVAIDEVAANGWILSVQRYVTKNSSDESSPTTSELRSEKARVSMQLSRIDAEIEDLIRSFG